VLLQQLCNTGLISAEVCSTFVQPIMSKFANFSTTMGDFKVELYADKLPVTCCKFVTPTTFRVQ
jgi:hypothetical protein